MVSQRIPAWEDILGLADEHRISYDEDPQTVYVQFVDEDRPDYETYEGFGALSGFSEMLKAMRDADFIETSVEEWTRLTHVRVGPAGRAYMEEFTIPEPPRSIAENQRRKTPIGSSTWYDRRKVSVWEGIIRAPIMTGIPVDGIVGPRTKGALADSINITGNYEQDVKSMVNNIQRRIERREGGGW